MHGFTPTEDEDVVAEVVAPDMCIFRNREGRRWCVKGPLCGPHSPCQAGAATSGALIVHALARNCTCPVELFELPPCAPGSF